MSASMKAKDVEWGSRRITRSAAVFECCSDFVRDQIRSGAGNKDTCTIITFNDQAHQWTGSPNAPSMCRISLHNTFDNIKALCSVELGTKYIEGLRAGLRMCRHMKKHTNAQSVVFLSDGKPGDLNFGSRNEEELLDAMDQLREAVLPGKLQFHSIGFGDNDFVWLQKMAACVNGKFHNQRARGGGFSFTEMSSTFRSISSELTAMRSDAYASSTSVPSSRVASTMLSYNRSGAFMQQLTCSVLFFSIKQGKWWCTGKGISALVSSSPFAEGSFRKAFRVAICLDSLPLKVTKALKDLRPKEDECGSLLLVGKEKRFTSEKLALRFQSANYRSLLHAKTQLQAFKNALKSVPKLPKGYAVANRATFLNCLLLSSTEGQPCRFLSIEKFIEGPYTKFNNNQGYVHPTYKSGEFKGKTEELVHDIAQAFSHFTWANSNGQSLVCDIQGVGLTWTDPQVNSLGSDDLGQCNLGGKGIQSFFASHVCNGLCRALKISGKWPS